MSRKSENRWPRAHETLKEIYEAKSIASRLSMAEFGKKYGLGSSSMVWQYLTGYTPLNYDSAAKFAKGLDCRIEDFCPEMAEELSSQILPHLTPKTLKRAVKAAMTAVVLLLVTPRSEDVSAATLHKTIMSHEGEKVSLIHDLNTHMRAFFGWILGLSSQFLSGA